MERQNITIDRSLAAELRGLTNQRPSDQGH